MHVDRVERRGYEPRGSKLPEYLPPFVKDFYTGVFLGQVSSPQDREQQIHEAHFTFEPLTHLTPEEDRVLERDTSEDYDFIFHKDRRMKALAGETVLVTASMDKRIKKYADLTDAYLFGVITEDHAKGLHKKFSLPFLTPEGKEKVLTNPLIATNGRLIQDGVHGPISWSHSATLCKEDGPDNYRFTHTGFVEMLGRIRQFQGKSNEDVLVGIDIGRSSGLAANDAEQLDPNLLMTNMTSHPEMAAYPLRGGQILGIPERMPEAYREKFDLILGNTAFIYNRYPDKAVQNALHALSIGGILRANFSDLKAKLGYENKLDELNERVFGLFHWMKYLESEGKITFLPSPSEGETTHDLVESTKSVRQGLLYIQKRQGILDYSSHNI